MPNTYDPLNHTTVAQFVENLRLKPWFELACQIERAIYGFAVKERELFVPKGTADPSFLTMQLVSRALGALQGTIVLAERGLAVEARTMSRTCAECGLAFLGLKFDPEHYQAMLGDDVNSAKSRTKLFLNLGASLSSEQIDALRKQVAGFEARGKMPRLNYEEAAKRGNAEIHYLMFRQISADAAHVSLLSLSRYLSWDQSGNLNSISPIASDGVDWLAETLNEICNFMFLVAVIAAEFLPDDEMQASIGKLWEQYKELLDRNA